MTKKTVLLTGASRGIGKAIAERLRIEYDILAPSRRELDLSNDTSIREFSVNIRKRNVDILINNAGINYPQWIDETTEENIQETFQVNLIAPIKLVRAVVPNMKIRRWGRIVNVSSAFGIVARGKQVLYTATKHGIIGATKSLALELAKDNILVNAICPGFANTDLVVSKNTQEKIAKLLEDVPLKRLIEPNEIAELIAFLVSEKNTAITGACIVIDAGFTIH